MDRCKIVIFDKFDRVLWESEKISMATILYKELFWSLLQYFQVLVSDLFSLFQTTLLKFGNFLENFLKKVKNQILQKFDNLIWESEKKCNGIILENEQLESLIDYSGVLALDLFAFFQTTLSNFGFFLENFPLDSSAFPPCTVHVHVPYGS